METSDVLIVGGGPAGAATATRLGAAGLDVVVLDKARFPRDKPCAGWITPAVLDAFPIDLADYRRHGLLQPITGFRTGRIGGPILRTEYGRPVSYAIRRCEFDHYLLKRCSARRRLSEPVTRICRQRGDWVINERYRAPLLVGAGGSFCPVARWVRADQPTDPSTADARVIYAEEIECEMLPRQRRECAVDPEIPELYFCDDLRGYGWCVRKGDFLNVGLGREDRRGLPRHVAEFCAVLRDRGRIPAKLSGSFRGHAYALNSGGLCRLMRDAVLLVGDAAGLAYPQSGEGIWPAIESGRVAADVIVAAAGDYRAENLQDYPQRVNRRFGQSRVGASIRGWLPRRLQCVVAARLLQSRWFTRRVLLDRWFLHRQDAQ
jgi:flavin-dependent dehydrogenase